MKSRQFPTFADALAYMEGKGKLKYFGREDTTYVYTLTIGIKVYHLLVHDNGFVEVTHERYKPPS